MAFQKGHTPWNKGMRKGKKPSILRKIINFIRGKYELLG